MNLRSILAGLLSLVLTVQSVPAAPFAASPVPAIPDFVKALTPPESLGFLDSYYAGETNHPVVLIQDLHANYGVQKNIFGLLKHFQPQIASQERPISVGVEGAWGTLDLSILRKETPQVRAGVGEFLLKEAEMTGMEHFAAMSESPVNLVGIDDPQDYLLHGELIRKSIEARLNLASKVTTLRHTIDQSKAQAPRRLKRLWRLETSFHDGKLGLPELARALDLNELKTYGDAESALYEAKVQAAGRSGKAFFLKNVVKADQDLALLSRLLRFQLTLEEVEFVGRKSSEMLVVIQALLPGEKLDDWRETIRMAIDYYAVALLRDKPLSQHALDLATQNPGMSVVIVTGGFHTAGITDVLRRKRMSYVVISPRVASHTAQDEDFLLRRTLGEHLTAADVQTATVVSLPASQARIPEHTVGLVAQGAGAPSAPRTRAMNVIADVIARVREAVALQGKQPVTLALASGAEPQEDPKLTPGELFVKDFNIRKEQSEAITGFLEGEPTAYKSLVPDVISDLENGFNYNIAGLYLSSFKGVAQNHGYTVTYLRNGQRHLLDQKFLTHEAYASMLAPNWIARRISATEIVLTERLVLDGAKFQVLYHGGLFRVGPLSASQAAAEAAERLRKTLAMSLAAWGAEAGDIEKKLIARFGGTAFNIQIGAREGASRDGRVIEEVLPHIGTIYLDSQLFEKEDDTKLFLAVHGAMKWIIYPEAVQEREVLGEWARTSILAKHVGVDAFIKALRGMGPDMDYLADLVTLALGSQPQDEKELLLARKDFYATLTEQFLRWLEFTKPELLSEPARYKGDFLPPVSRKLTPGELVVVDFNPDSDPFPFKNSRKNLDPQHVFNVAAGSLQDFVDFANDANYQVFHDGSSHIVDRNFLTTSKSNGGHFFAIPIGPQQIQLLNSLGIKDAEFEVNLARGEAEQFTEMHVAVRSFRDTPETQLFGPGIVAALMAHTLETTLQRSLDRWKRDHGNSRRWNLRVFLKEAFGSTTFTIRVGLHKHPYIASDGTPRDGRIIEKVDTKGRVIYLDRQLFAHGNDAQLFSAVHGAMKWIVHPTATEEREVLARWVLSTSNELGWSAFISALRGLGPDMTYLAGMVEAVFPGHSLYVAQTRLNTMMQVHLLNAVVDVFLRYMMRVKADFLIERDTAYRLTPGELPSDEAAVTVLKTVNIAERTTGWFSRVKLGVSVLAQGIATREQLTGLTATQRRLVFGISA